MTREELHALLADVFGIRLQPIERETIFAAIDLYVEHEADRADVPANGPDE